MDRFLRLNLPIHFRLNANHILAAVWVLGLISGSIISTCAGNTLISTMRAAAFGRVSILGLFSAILLPLLFSAFAVYISQRWLLIPIAFYKAFVFSYLGFGVMAAYSCAGWLVRLLLMFSDSAMTPLLYLFWSRQLSEKEDRPFRFAAAMLILGFLIGSIDYFIISPFLAEVISL